MSDIAEIRRRAHIDPESLSAAEWKEIHKLAFGVPKEVDSDGDAITYVHPRKQKGKKNEWW